MARMWLVLCLVLGGRAAAQEPARRVDVRVTDVAGGSAYVDQGARAGAATGDTCLLLPPGALEIECRVTAVAPGSSRIEPLNLERVDEIVAGLAGVLLLPRPDPADVAPAVLPPATQPDQATQPGPQSRSDGHPDWTHPPESWTTDVPLLAPAQGLPASERDMRVNGRVYTLLETTVASEPVEQRYVRSRTGIDADWENPFGYGGEIGLDAIFIARASEFGSGLSPDETETFFTPRRLYYRQGGRRDEPHAWTAGRFLPGEFPELGILDGAEYVYRQRSGSRVGASVGYLPIEIDELPSGEDLQASGFYRFVNGPSEEFSLGAAYQKTWHEGVADRDLVLGRLEWYPTQRLSMRGTAWVDYYDSNDDLKSPGFELTRMHANASWRTPDGHGLSLFGSYFRWPQLLRDDTVDLAPERIERARTGRLGLQGWRMLGDHVRLSGRVDAWEDEDDTGGSGDVSFSLRDLLWDDGDVGLTLYGSNGKFSSVVGTRLSANRWFERSSLRLFWDLGQNEVDGGVSSDPSFLQSRLRINYERRLGRGWDLSLWGEHLGGDELAAGTVGIQLQKRL